MSHAARLVNQPALMDANAVRLVGAASRLFVYPSFMCTENDPRWPAPESWRAMTQEAMLVAARRAIPSNSIYVNRTRKDCAAERNALPSTRLEPGTLYIVRLPAAIDWLARIEAPGQCAVKGEAVLCADFVPAAR